MTYEYNMDDATQQGTCSGYMRELCLRNRSKTSNTMTYADALEQRRQEAKTRSIAPNAYNMSIVMESDAGNQFRSGNYNGQSYMTAEDFVACYNRRRGYNIQNTQANKPAIAKTNETKVSQSVKSIPVENSGKVAFRSAGVQTNVRAQKINSSNRELHITREFKTVNPTSKKNVERKKSAKITNIAYPYEKAVNSKNKVSVKASEIDVKAKAVSFVQNWFPKENRENRDVPQRRRLPLATMLTVFIISVSLMLMVGSSIMVSQAKGDLSILQDEYTALQEKEREIQNQLDKKNDLEVIEEIAVNQIGMISQDYIDVRYIDMIGEEKIEVFDDETGDDIGLATVLSAIISGRN